MRSLLLTAAACIAIAGVANAEVRRVSGFTGVSAADRIRAEVSVGETYRVEVLGSDADKVTTRVDAANSRCAGRAAPTCDDPGA